MEHYKIELFESTAKANLPANHQRSVKAEICCPSNVKLIPEWELMF